MSSQPVYSPYDNKEIPTFGLVHRADLLSRGYLEKPSCAKLFGDRGPELVVKESGDVASVPTRANVRSVRPNKGK